MSQTTATSPAVNAGQPSPSTTVGGHLRHALVSVYPAIVLSIVVLVVWESISRIFKLPQFVLPAPSAIGTILLTRQASLSQAMWVTAEEILYGFL